MQPNLLLKDEEVSMCKAMSICIVAIALVMLAGSHVRARDLRSTAPEPETAQPDSMAADTDSPNTVECVHNYGNVRFCVTNHGILGSPNREYDDCESGDPAESFEFPAGSLKEYLFFGGLWVGAVVDTDTLVSVGTGGWYYLAELWPCADPECEIEKRSRILSNPNYDPSAVSDLDHLAEYTDTLDDPSYTGTDWDGRTHLPLNIAVSQRSYSWAAGDTSEFVIVEYAVKTLGTQPLTGAFIGIYVDGDVLHPMHYSDGYIDDVSGHRICNPNVLGCDSIRYAWTADNDGDPWLGYYDYTSTTGVLGVALLGTAAEAAIYSFNWWNSYYDVSYDWGPWHSDNIDFAFPQGNLGTPVGDPSKYFLLSNGEIDYDQLEAATDHTGEGWLDPGPEGIANGNDTKFLLSFGPVDIIPGDSVEFAVVFAAGDSFHVGPTDYEDLYDPHDPGPYQAALDYSLLEHNLTLAKLLYDHSYTFPETGDVSWDFLIDIDDAVGLILYSFYGEPEPPCLSVCDVNCDGETDLDDIIYLLDFIFRGGPPPGEGC